jgi:hypothetical protein
MLGSSADKQFLAELRKPGFKLLPRKPQKNGFRKAGFSFVFVGFPQFPQSFESGGFQAVF